METVAEQDVAPAQESSDTPSEDVQGKEFDDPSENIITKTLIAVVASHADGLDETDPQQLVLRTLAQLPDDATGSELVDRLIQNAVEKIGEEPQYSRLAARMLTERIHKQAYSQGATSFSQGIQLGNTLGLIGDQTAEFVKNHALELDRLIDPDADQKFEYFGLRTVYDRYLLRHPETRKVLETPQAFLLRVACGLFNDVDRAGAFYTLMRTFRFLPSSPTLFNSGTRHTQLSSCYLLDSPHDSIEDIYKTYRDIALLAKYAGGIGVSWSRVRSRGALIRGTNGLSNGIVPWLNTLDASVAAVNQGGKRKGAAVVYLEPWHPDILEFLELRDNTGEDARRTHNLNLAHWIPDLFMRRVENNETWSLFDPDELPELPDLWGDAFDAVYEQAEKEQRFVRQIPARELYAKMMRTLAQTGNGWMCFKDQCNRTCNQAANAGNVVHLSNLCTEIVEVTSAEETAVCNLGSVNLAAHLNDRGDDIDWLRLHRTVGDAVVFLDRVIDVNFYPTREAEESNRKWRPIGLGVMGLQDVFFQLGLPFDSAEAKDLSTRIAEEIYLTALETSCELAQQNGPHPAYTSTHAARGKLHPELFGWGDPTKPSRETWLRGRIAVYGLRNSLLITIAPTATIASIAGVYECIEPQVSNLFKRETLSGEFLQVNPYLVRELKSRGLWTAEIRNRIRQDEGSVQQITELPDRVRQLYRTAWELPQRALIDLAAARGPYVDQSQSLNLFMAEPTIGKLASMYRYAWISGLKTTYYLRSRPATRIQPATVPLEQDVVACSLENPEMCEACQ